MSYTSVRYTVYTSCAKFPVRSITCQVLGMKPWPLHVAVDDGLAIEVAHPEEHLGWATSMASPSSTATCSGQGFMPKTWQVIERTGNFAQLVYTAYRTLVYDMLGEQDHRN